MPILVRVAELQPGMRLAEPFVYCGRVMLPGGKELSKDHIGLLKKKFPNYHLKVGDPVLDGIIKFEDDAKAQQTSRIIRTRIAKSLETVQERVGDHMSIGSLDFMAIQQNIQELIEFIKENAGTAVLLTRHLEEGTYLSEHAGNVFYLSMMLGLVVRKYIQQERERMTSAKNLTQDVACDLTSLGIGAMFCDIGMAGRPELFDPDYQLTAEDRQFIETHPNRGAELLPTVCPAVAKMVVKTHHENISGDGYPKKIIGTKLHVFTRIVRIADSYDAATSGHIYRQAKSPTRVLWEMSVGPYKRFYDPGLVRVFTRLVQPFPIGSQIKLANGTVGVVVGFNNKSPLKPKIIIAFDQQGNRLNKDQLIGPLWAGDQRETRMREFDGENLNFVYDNNLDDIPPPRPSAFRSMLDAMRP